MLTEEAIKLRKLEEEAKKAKGEAKNVLESQIKAIKQKFRIKDEEETAKK